MRAVAEDPGDALHGLRRLVREHHRGARVPRCACHGTIRFGVGELEHADRGEQEWAGEALPEQLDAGVAVLDVARHARHDSPAVKRRPVRGDGVLVARAGGDVVERVRRHPAAGRGLEPVGVKRDRWPPAADAVAVDLRLAPRPFTGVHHSTRRLRRPPVGPMPRVGDNSLYAREISQRWLLVMPFRMEQPPKLRERHDVNRVSPFRKGINRIATAPDNGPQPCVALGAHPLATPPFAEASPLPYDSISDRCSGWLHVMAVTLRAQGRLDSHP